MSFQIRIICERVCEEPCLNVVEGKTKAEKVVVDRGSSDILAAVRPRQLDRLFIHVEGRPSQAGSCFNANRWSETGMRIKNASIRQHTYQRTLGVIEEN
jgi:hypothetical protein